MKGTDPTKKFNGFVRFLMRIYRTFVKLPPKTDNITNIGLYKEIMDIKPKLKADNSNKENFLIWQKKGKSKLKELLNLKVSYNVPKYRILKKKKIQEDLYRYFITYKSLDCVDMYAYLFKHERKKERKRHSIIVLSSSEEGIVHTAGLKKSINNKNGLYFAKRGYNVICPEHRGCGYLSSVPWERVFGNANSIGKSYMGVVLGDHILALNILLSLDTTDKEMVGVIGLSLGGLHSVYLGALDERIKFAVVFGWLSNKSALLTGHIHVWSVYDLFTYFNPEDICALIAPKPAFYSNGKYEQGDELSRFGSDKAMEVLEKINKSYALFNKKAIYKEHQGGHEFDNKLAFSFLKEEEN